MAKLSSSGRLIDYRLRPCKQVERYLILDILQLVRGNWGDLTTLPYIGFGSFYFVDFIMMHKQLNYHALVSLESKDFERALFNRPFSCVDVRNETAREFFSTWKGCGTLWLDFDGGFDSESIRTLRSCIASIDDSSLLFLTVNMSPEFCALGSPADGDAEIWERIHAQYREFAITDVVNDIDDNVKFYSVLPNIILEFFDNIAHVSHKDISVFFLAKYKDGSQMFTIGLFVEGPRIAANDALRGVENITGCCTPMSPLNARNGKISTIRFPLLTARETDVLLSHLPQQIDPGTLPFLTELDKRAFAEYYKRIPSYREVLSP